MRMADSRAEAIAAHAPTSRWLVWSMLLLGLVANLLALSGGAWDLAYHLAFRVDTFWSPPHILLYSGMLLMLLLGLAVLALVLWEAGTRGGLATALLRRPLLLMPLLANLGFLLTGPLDDAWHRLFGRDSPTIWTVPHALLLANMALTALSIVVLGLWLRAERPRGDLAPPHGPASRRWAELMILLGLGLLLAHLWSFVGEWEHGSIPETFHGQTWPYPLVVTTLTGFCFALTARVAPGRAGVVALVCLIGFLLKQTPAALLVLFGLPWGFKPDIIALFAGALYSALVWRWPGWRLWVRHAAFGAAFVGVILLAQQLDQIPTLSGADLALTAPALPLTSIAGGLAGDALGRGLRSISNER